MDAVGTGVTRNTDEWLIYSNYFDEILNDLMLAESMLRFQALPKRKRHGELLKSTFESKIFPSLAK